MTDWIKWNGGECPIKSDKTWVEVKLPDGCITRSAQGKSWRWTWNHEGKGGDIIAYRITEDHEPKCDQPLEWVEFYLPLTREQITAQIEALQKQLDEMPKPYRMHWDGGILTKTQHTSDTHYFDIETINGVPHIHGVAMKECGK